MEEVSGGRERVRGGGQVGRRGRGRAEAGGERLRRKRPNLTNKIYTSLV